MARVLIVGCGCRGRALARDLRAEGHAVRGTTRDPARVAEIEATGAEAAVCDPGRLGTLLPALEGVAFVCWLLASAQGEGAADLHATRLERLFEELVDTPVRGVVYEAAGTLPADVLAGAQAIAQDAQAALADPRRGASRRSRRPRNLGRSGAERYRLAHAPLTPQQRYTWP